MSCDLLVEVALPPTDASLASALVKLGAPCVVAAPLAEWRGNVQLDVALHGVPLHKTVLEMYGPSAGNDKAFMLLAHDDDEIGAAWTIATALAIAGKGKVTDAQSGRVYAPSKASKLIAKGDHWKQRVEKAYAELAPSEKAFRARRPGETDAACRERLFLHSASNDAIAAYVREQITNAARLSNDGEALRLAELVAVAPAFVEAVFDACFRAGRVDLARTIGRRFGDELLRYHFLEVVRWQGAVAAAYASFVAEVIGARADAALLDAARRAAASDEMRAAL